MPIPPSRTPVTRTALETAERVARGTWMPIAVALLGGGVAGAQLGCRYPHERDASELEASCPEGSEWDGYRCVRNEVACPDGSSWVSGKCVAHAGEPIPGGTAELPDTLAGSWSVLGARASGQPYAGSAAITPLAKGGPWRITYSIAGSTYSGVMVSRGDVVSVGWADGDEYGVVDYVAKGDGNLDGVWFDGHSPKPGRELLSGGLPNLAGVYTITSAKSPNGSSYSGTCDLAVTGDLHTLIWHVGKDSFRGLGIRAGDVLSVGFSTAPSGNFGVVQYKNEGARLVGRWAEWSQKSPALGTEVLSRK